MRRQGLYSSTATGLVIAAFLAGSTVVLAADPAPVPADAGAAPAAASDGDAVPLPSADDATAPESAKSGDTSAAGTESVSPAQKLIDGMAMRDGLIALSGGQAEVNVAKDFAFLDQKDARTLIVDVYGNPPSVAEGVLGVLLPRNASPLAVESWFAVITYEEEGHVSDDDAASINYDDLLKEMQDATLEESKEREKAGYETLQLVGWAQPPSYDKAEHKLYWAKDIKFGKTEGHTLNYALRVLGRTGVLQVNVVADTKQLAEINEKVPELLKMVSFKQGQRYADFDESTDAVAAYGLAGLIAGGAAAKAGLFKGLIALLLASKKLLVVGLAAVGGAIWGGVRWLFGRKST